MMESERQTEVASRERKRERELQGDGESILCRGREPQV